MKNVQKSLQKLKCFLGDPEILEIANLMANQGETLSELKEEAKRATTAYKGKIKEIADQISILQRKILNKFEFRHVECEERFDFKAGKITVIRIDTGEIVEVRDMTAADRQTTFIEEDNQ